MREQNEKGGVTRAKILKERPHMWLFRFPRGHLSNRGGKGGCQRARGGEQKLVFGGYGVPVWGEEEILEKGGGDGCIML